MTRRLQGWRKPVPSAESTLHTNWNINRVVSKLHRGIINYGINELLVTLADSIPDEENSKEQAHVCIDAAF